MRSVKRLPYHVMYCARNLSPGNQLYKVTTSIVRNVHFVEIPFHGKFRKLSGNTSFLFLIEASADSSMSRSASARIRSASWCWSSARRNRCLRLSRQSSWENLSGGGGTAITVLWLRSSFGLPITL